MRGVMLVVENISFERYFQAVFQPVSFALKPGSLLLVTGSNGCGKTTLIRVLAEILHPSEGTLENRFAGLSYVGHHLGIKDDLSVLENLRFMRDFFGKSSDDAEQAVTQLGLQRVEEQLARTLSAGQRKRCALGRLLLSQSELWLLDEPYSNLDDEGVRVVDKLVCQHMENGGACIIATHGAHRPDWAATEHCRLQSGAAA
jgi:heme exporter protein A